MGGGRTGGTVQFLKGDGLHVYGAEGADKALGYADENIDVVLSDLHMGDVSGIDLLQLWKKQKPDTQFILVTGERAARYRRGDEKRGVRLRHQANQS